MGDFFRSEEMALCQLFIQPEAAYASVNLLGEAGIVQFRDLNEELSAFHRKFVSEVRRCEEIERKLRYIAAEVKKDGVPIPDLDQIPLAPNPREIIDLEAQVERTENEIQELSHNGVSLKSNYVELTELKHVLEKTDAFFQEQDGDSANRALIGDDSHATRTQLGFVTGVVPRERVFSFERMLWRISRGNVFLRRADIEEDLLDPASGNLLSKTVFVAFFQGEQLKSRVKKVCAGFHATLYPSPAAPDERREMVTEVRTRLEDLNMVLNQTDDHRRRVLVTVAKELPAWTVMVKKMKAIYHTMNMFNMDVTKKCLIGECWVPVKDLNFINDALVEGGRSVGSTIPSFLNVIQTSEKSPTFNRTNKVTQGFQNLIDAYGIATYREVNPALYTIITFPFLFGVMFGDLGHGFILTLFGGWMIIMEKKFLKQKSDNEIWNIFFGGRYIILLMGFFAMYAGLLYNDMFSLSINLFGTHWKVSRNESTVLGNTYLTLDPEYEFEGEPYPFGMDPIWQTAQNKIIFLNSFKMKMSIIMGVIHMIFGVCLNVVNLVYFRKSIMILLEFLPQLLFLLLLFFYLVVLMVMKLLLYSAQSGEYQRGSHCAPSVLILFINMMLFQGTTESEGTTEFPACDPYMYTNQEMVQKILVVLALLCIPVMLLGKPIYLIYFDKSGQVHKSESNGTQSTTTVEMNVINGTAGTSEVKKPSPSTAQDEDEEHSTVTDIFTHQVIHTIEYVLSTVSHTASYLRLWALSLAHAELSEVLWSMVITKVFTILGTTLYGSIAVYIAFAFWATLTISILVLMEGLSAFLHTLRLHWVEFMSKFYKGMGYPFQPFSLNKILDESTDEPAT